MIDIKQQVLMPAAFSIHNELRLYIKLRTYNDTATYSV